MKRKFELSQDPSSNIYIFRQELKNKFKTATI